MINGFLLALMITSLILRFLQFETFLISYLLCIGEQGTQLGTKLALKKKKIRINSLASVKSLILTVGVVLK